MAWPDTNQFGNCHERETSPGLKFIHSTNKNSSIVYQFDSKYWKLAGRKLFKYHQHAGQEPTHVDRKIEIGGKKHACCMECVYHHTNEHNKHVFMTLQMKLIKFLILSLYLFFVFFKDDISNQEWLSCKSQRTQKQYTSYIQWIYRYREHKAIQGHWQEFWLLLKVRIHC